MASNLSLHAKVEKMWADFKELNGPERNGGRTTKTELDAEIGNLLSLIRQFINNNENNLDEELEKQLKNAEAECSSLRTDLQSLKNFHEHWEEQLGNAQCLVSFIPMNTLPNKERWLNDLFDTIYIPHTGAIANLVSIRAALSADTTKVKNLTTSFKDAFEVSETLQRSDVPTVTLTRLVGKGRHQGSEKYSSFCREGSDIRWHS